MMATFSTLAVTRIDSQTTCLMDSTTCMHDALIGQISEGLLQAVKGGGFAAEGHAHQHHTVTDNVAFIEPQLHPAGQLSCSLTTMNYPSFLY